VNASVSPPRENAAEQSPTPAVSSCTISIELEEKRNAANEGLISMEAGRVAVRVIRTDEEQMIAKTVCRVLGLSPASEKGI
jgi:acetate kinase